MLKGKLYYREVHRGRQQVHRGRGGRPNSGRAKLVTEESSVTSERMTTQGSETTKNSRSTEESKTTGRK
jgi:hypothetical protein